MNGPEQRVRDARPDDDEAIVAVARAHGFDGTDDAVDPAYRRHVAAHGRLVVAADPAVVGFGGAIDVDGVRLVTDLFLLPAAQGRGLGGAMLRALLDGAAHAMTFSSAHERAVPTYARAGLLPRWQLRYWRGRIDEVRSTSGIAAADVAAGEWRGDRADLVAHWSGRGARFVRLSRDPHVVGWSIVVPAAADQWTVARLVTGEPHGPAMRALLSTLPAGATVRAAVPEHSAAGAVLDGLGFAVDDIDVCCTTGGVDLDDSVAVLHPGLG